MMEVVLEIDGIRDGMTNEPINNAHVEMTAFYKASKEKVTGVKWPVALRYVEGTDGCYRASFPYLTNYDDVIGYANGRPVDAEIKATIGDVSITVKRDLLIKYI